MVTKGDANKAPDAALVRAHQIKGKVLFTVPYVGKAFMKSTKEFAAFFYNRQFNSIYHIKNSENFRRNIS